MFRIKLLALGIAGLCLAALYPASPATAGVNVWTPIGPDGGTVQALAADPQQANILYAGTTGGLFKSTDGGTSWSWSGRGLKPEDVMSVAVAPSNRSVVYAGTPKGVFISTDGAASWRDTRFRRIITALAVDPRDPRRVWAGTFNDGLYRSTDAGAHWQHVVTGSPSGAGKFVRVTSLLFDPFNPRTLYAGVGPLTGELDASGVYQSADGGATWRQSALPPDSSHGGLVLLAADLTTPGLIYASFAPPLFSTPIVSTLRTEDGGVTWQNTGGGFPVAVDRSGVVYAGDRRSPDRGASWEPVAGLPEATRYLAGDGKLWAGTERQGVFRSLDGAVTWQAASRGLHATAVLSLAVDPERPRVLYAATVQTGPVKTQSSGTRWRPIRSGLPEDEDEAGLRTTSVLALDPQQPETLYLAWNSAQRGLARSDDGGESWLPLRESENRADQFRPFEVVADPTASGVVYVNVQDLPGGGSSEPPCRLERSDDLGATRQCLPPFAGVPGFDVAPEARLVADPARPGALWLFDREDRLWKSTDRGANWTTIRPRGLARSGVPRSLAIDPSRPNHLLLGTERRAANTLPTRLWKSEDGGQSWRAWGNGIPAVAAVTGLRIDPSQPAIVYAVVDDLQDPDRIRDRSGVYWSRDGGRSFQPLQNGLAGRVRQLELAPQNPRRLFAATETHGIYTLTRR